MQHRPWLSIGTPHPATVQRTTGRDPAFGYRFIADDLSMSAKWRDGGSGAPRSSSAAAGPDARMVIRRRTSGRPECG
jgi:hypothetical protein